VRVTQARSRLLLVRVVFGVRGTGSGRRARRPGGILYVVALPHTRYEGQGHGTENTKQKKSSLIIRSVKGVSAFPFLNGRVFQPPQNRTKYRQKIRSSVYISYVNLGCIRQ
jgi:hypothetical protein